MARIVSVNVGQPVEVDWAGRAGDPIEVVSVPGHAITIVDHTRLPELEAIEDLAAEPRRKLVHHLGLLPTGTNLSPVL